MAATAIDLLTDEKVLNKAVEEFRQRIGSRKYKSPIPIDSKPELDAWDKK